MKTRTALLPILGALLLPAAAHADMIQCTDDATELQQPCTVTVDTSGGARFTVPAGKVITSYTGTFTDNASVGLRLMRRNGDGTFTSDGSTGYTYVAAGRQTVEANLAIPAGDHTVALDLHSGSVQATPGAGRILADDHIWDDGETGSSGDPADYDLDVDITLADAPKEPAPSSGGSGSSSDGGSSGSSSSDDDSAPASKDWPAGLSFDGRSVVAPDGRSVEVYARNQTNQELAGSIRLKVGHKLLKAARTSGFDYSSSEDISLPIPERLGKRIARHGHLKATVIAKLKGKKGAVRKTAKVKVIRGGAKGFDGTYRGKGPLVIKVTNGVITAISQPMNTYCSQNGHFVMRTMQTGLGFPALIKKDGSFSHKASLSGDSFTYRGKLSRKGTSKGYNSLWYSTFDNDPETGFFRAVSCVQASNWTAKRG